MLASITLIEAFLWVTIYCFQEARLSRLARLRRDDWDERSRVEIEVLIVS